MRAVPLIVVALQDGSGHICGHTENFSPSVAHLFYSAKRKWGGPLVLSISPEPSPTGNARQEENHSVEITFLKLLLRGQSHQRILEVSSG